MIGLYPGAEIYIIQISIGIITVRELRYKHKRGPCPHQPSSAWSRNCITREQSPNKFGNPPDAPCRNRATYNEVNMGRPVRVSVQSLKYLPSRSIARDWIRHRPQADEVVGAIFAGRESPSKVHVWLIWILLLIQAVRAGMPDV
jgi:hypothetical protein